MRNKPISVVQVAGWYAPHRIGGTEVYVEGLVDELRRLGVNSTVLVPRIGMAPDAYLHAATQVETYPVNECPTQAELQRGAPHTGFDVFLRRLERHRGAIYHQHTWTRGCGLLHLSAAKDLGFRTVLTVHVASNFCLRGTMMRFGEIECDGRIDEVACGACWLHDRGLPRFLAKRVTTLPLPLSRATRLINTRLGTALAARALASQKMLQFREMIRSADRVIAVAQWVYDALVANGVPAGKAVLNRQGITHEYEMSVADVLHGHPRGGRSQYLELVYIGTFSPNKGLTLAVQAIRLLPKSLKVRLTVHAPKSRDPEQSAYEGKVRSYAEEDSRIVFGPQLARSEIAQALSKHDVLVVPSVCLETGPLVVLEAQAVGLLVLGSRLGGIRELVRDHQEGELISASDAGAWAAAIARLASRMEACPLQHFPQRVRSMTTVGAEMADLYASLSNETLADRSRPISSAKDL